MEKTTNRKSYYYPYIFVSGTQGADKIDGTKMYVRGYNEELETLELTTNINLVIPNSNRFRCIEKCQWYEKKTQILPYIHEEVIDCG